MATRSSIFSSEILERIRDSPGNRKGWVCFLVLAALVLGAGHGALLGRVFRDPAWSSPDPRVLCIGTSHQMDAIDRGALPDGVDLLDDAGLDLRLAERTFRKHRSRWKNLELAIIEVDEFSLLGDAVGARLDDLSGLCGTLDLGAWNLIGPEDDLWRRYRIIANLWYGRGFPALSAERRLTAERLFVPPPAPSDQFPGSNVVDPRTLDSGAADHRIAYARHCLFMDTEQQNFRTRNLPALLRLVAELRASNCRVVLVTYPTSDIDRAARPPVWDAMIEEAITAVQERFPEVTHWDHHADPRFTPDHFKNVDHLNETGRALFTETLVQRLTPH